MNITTMIDAISAAIAQDSAIAAWCTTTYGHTHKVFVSLDLRNPPGQDDCPYVALWPDDKLVGYGISEKGHGLMFDISVYDESTRTHDGIGNLVEYNGVARVEALRKLVETAVAGVDLGNVSLENIDIQYDSPESFPFFTAGMAVSFQEENMLGADYLE